MKRINKTKNNLTKTWELLDSACGSLENAMQMISAMVDMPEDVEQAMSQIDFSAITSLKEQIEILMEKSENN